MILILMMLLNKEYWKNRYQNDDTGWDTGSITQPLKEYVDQITDKNLKILIPGAGNGHEFDYLVEHGFTNVWVIDIADQPIQKLQSKYPQLIEKILLGDFFDHDSQYDIIIEQTFFCALDPEMRKNYVSKMHSLLFPKGKIVGLLFDFPLTPEGPPFGGSKKEYLSLFSEKFFIKKIEKAYNSIKPRADRELFFIFEKK